MRSIIEMLLILFCIFVTLCGFTYIYADFLGIDCKAVNFLYVTTFIGAVVFCCLFAVYEFY